MNAKMTLGAVGIAMLVVLGMSVLPTGSADEERTERGLPLATTDAHECELTIAGDECEGEVWIYGGQSPALNAAATAAGSGTFTVLIEETCCPSFAIETTFEVLIVGGQVEILSEETTVSGGGPWSGFPVTITGTAGEDAIALPSVLASAE